MIIRSDKVSIAYKPLLKAGLLFANLILTTDAIRRWGIRCTTLRLPQKQIGCTTIQIWHTAPLLYSVCYRLINFLSHEITENYI